MNWKNSEIPTHLPDDVQKCLCRKAVQTKLRKRYLKRGKNGDKLRILLVNVAFATAKVIKYLEAFIHRSNFMLAVDESTTIKNIKAKRTKSVLRLGGCQV